MFKGGNFEVSFTLESVKNRCEDSRFSFIINSTPFFDPAAHRGELKVGEGEKGIGKLLFSLH
jgi:hypothetical protein